MSLALNLTPMIDIVFNLLFFFLVCSRFGTLEGMLPAELPGHGAATQIEVPRTPIRIRLVAEEASPGTCRITIDRFHESPLPISALRPALEKIQQEPGFDSETPVHLLATDDVAWDHVVNAYNAALAARYERIFFAGGP
jgi:biopolymer transport protein ExbD